MPDDLEEVKPDAVETPEKDEDTPSAEDEDTKQEETPDVVEDKELSDEELALEVERLKEEAKKETDPKEKRHLEQQAGWSVKIQKEREKAKSLAEENQKTKESNQRFEKSLIEEVYSKTQQDGFGLEYFEKLAKDNPDIAEKVAQEKWKKTAKALILETKRGLANDGNEELKKQVTEEDIRAKVYHEVAVEQAQSTFDDLEDAEKKEAQEYFNEMVEGKTLTPTKAKQFAEMAKLYATRNRKPAIDKEKVMADKASTGISNKSGSKSEQVEDFVAIRTQLRNSGIPQHTIDLMYPLN